MKKISFRMVEKSLNSAIAALEIYNKPDCKYREETFCILMVNAFELLFKAKIIRDNLDDVKSIYVYYYPKNKNGNISKQKSIKKNRIGQPFTKDINSCAIELFNSKIITNNLIENLNLLIEIRDNAIHLINNENIKTKLYAICASSVRNYARLIEIYFGEFNLDRYNFFITPLNFDSINENYDTLNLNVAQKNFLGYVDLASSSASADDQFELLIKVDVKFIKNDIDESVLLKYASEGKKINFELTEEMFKKMYPFDNNQIISKIRNKQTTIKQNPRFNQIKKAMQTEEICCKVRYLDFINKRGAKKIYYNAGFVEKFLEKYNLECE